MTNGHITQEFSFNNYCSSEHREKLEDKFSKKLVILDDIDRRFVSFQMNKNNKIHNWLKYKEGFSEQLVRFLLDRMKLSRESIILEPFAGSGTTNFVCQTNGIDSVGFDILPTSKLAIEVKSKFYNFNLNELNQMLSDLNFLDIENDSTLRLNYISITKGAYPTKTDSELAFLQNWMSNNKYSDLSNKLLNLCIVNSLETVSYTKKDGQYLRWDARSEKVIENNKARLDKGRESLKTILNKGELPSILEVVKIELLRKIEDIKIIQGANINISKLGKIDFTQGNILFELPRLPDNSFDGVITSPPYCNRYDYTRSYALELVYLGLNDFEVKKMRQELLSCTVENQSKKERLYEAYREIDALKRFEQISSTVLSNKVYIEIIDALKKRGRNGDLNNKNIISMFERYIYELAFVYGEIHRVCKNNSKIYFVNDNVRYGGEVIPIDFLSSEIAESLGFEIANIFSIKQKKGNSSQQMKKFGRVPLRKSITEWIVKK